MKWQRRVVTAEEEVALDVVRVVRRLCVTVVAFVGVYPPLEVMEQTLSVVVVTEGAPLEVVCVCLEGLGQMWRLWV